jgi:glycosyltransferase involved in cell wall biosynthesis
MDTATFRLPVAPQDRITRRRPLHIALVSETYPPEVNGVAMSIGQIVRGLIGQGHSVQLVRPRQHAEEEAKQSDGFEEWLTGGVTIPRYDALRMGFPAGRMMTRLWTEKRPDIVHIVTEGPLGWSALGAARRLDLPVGSGFHTNFHSYSRHYGIGWLKAPITAYLRAFHNRTGATLVPTREIAGDLELEGFKNLHVVARGVDTELFSPARRSVELRRSWGLEDDDLAVLHVGRLAAEKNLPLLLEAFARIKAQQPSARLVLVGDGPMRSRLSGNPDCRFAGMRSGEDLATHYACGDLFLFPSMTETYGNVTAEALASGLAVVAYDYAAAGLLIEDGVNGLLAPSGDGEAFTAASLRLAGDPMLRATMRLRAREGVASMDWGGIVGDFVNAMSSVIRTHQPRANDDLHFAVAPD